MSGAHRHSEFVEEHSHVVMVDVADEERNHAALVVGGSENAHSRDAHQSFSGTFRQVAFPGLNVFDAEMVDVVECFGKCRDAHEVGCACLKLERKVGKRCFLKRHVANHLAAALIWSHRLEQAFLSVKHTYASRSIHLVG